RLHVAQLLGESVGPPRVGPPPLSLFVVEALEDPDARVLLTAEVLQHEALTDGRRGLAKGGAHGLFAEGGRGVVGPWDRLSGQQDLEALDLRGGFLDRVEALGHDGVQLRTGLRIVWSWKSRDLAWSSDRGGQVRRLDGGLGAWLHLGRGLGHLAATQDPRADDEAEPDADEGGAA